MPSFDDAGPTLPPLLQLPVQVVGEAGLPAAGERCII